MCVCILITFEWFTKLDQYVLKEIATFSVIMQLICKKKKKTQTQTQNIYILNKCYQMYPQNHEQ